MMRKRILAFVLAAALIGSLLVTAAVAEEDGAPAETAQSGESVPTENESGETAAVTDGESTAGETEKPQQDAETEIPAPEPVGTAVLCQSGEPDAGEQPDDFDAGRVHRIH